MAGFTFKKNWDGSNTEIKQQGILVNSGTYTVGDLVKLTSGFIALAAATNDLFGVITGFVTPDGISLDAAPSDAWDGTWTTATQTYVATSDNQTDKQISALVNVHPFAIYSATPDATIGTTTGSNLIGYYTDIIDEAQPDESDASTTTGQLMIWGVDPDDSTKGLYSINENWAIRAS